MTYNNPLPADKSKTITESAAVIGYVIPQRCTEFLEGLHRWLSPKTLSIARQEAQRLLPLYRETNVRFGQQRLRDAESLFGEIEKWLTDLDEERTQLKPKLLQIGPKHLFKTRLYGAAVSVALGCELALSASTLPQIFQVAGILGWMVASAPVAATIAIEELAGHLLDALEERSRRAGRWLSAAAALTLGVLLLGALAANAHMVLSIAAAREEAAHILSLLSQATGDSEVTINQSIVSACIAWVSIVVILNSAILLRTVFNDCRAMCVCRESERKWVALNAEKIALELEFTKAKAELAKRRDESISEREASLCDAVGQAWLVEAETTIQRILHDQEPPLEERVHAALVKPLFPDPFTAASESTIN